jgi:cytochrome c-type biogenesis protein CcmE
VRFMVVIVSLTAIALGMIHLRRAELVARHQYQQLEDRRIQLRRKLWDQQSRLGYLVSPGEVRRRVDEMSLNLVDKDQAACAAPKSRPAVPPAAMPAHERKR